MPEPRDTRTEPELVSATEPSGTGDTQGIPRAPTAPGGDLSFLSAPQGPDELGRLGHYRILEELGRGGMGLVLLAEDAKLRRPAALKVMLPRHAADAVAKERFLREARVAAQVKHDHIVTIYQVDEERAVPFIAMEFLQGMSLDAFLKAKGTPGISHVLRIGREIAEGLAAAHERGLVHRDVKPANVWLEAPHGRVKILDFGLARQQQEDAHLTGSGTVVGTPSYMSPEQARGERVDHRSDLFSLGGVLYTLCAGRPPFSGKTTMAVLTSLAIDQPPSVLQLNPVVAPALSELIDRLLSKRPDQRPASARAVAQALRALEKTPPTDPNQSQPVAVPVPMAVPVQEAADPWAGIDDDEATVKQSAPEAYVAAPQRRERLPLLIGLGLGALALIVGGILVMQFLNPRRAPTQPEEPEVTKADPKNKTGGTTKKADIIPPIKLGPPDLWPVDLPWPRHLPALAIVPFLPEDGKRRRQDWAKYLDRPLEEPNSIGMKMVLIPPGECRRGCPDGEEGSKAWEKPEHRVRLSYPCWVSAHEVTVGQFKQFVQSTSYKTSAERGVGASVYDEDAEEFVAHKELSWKNPGYPQDDSHPVTCVSWEDARAFCEWLSEKEKQNYRLPTGAEWEFCCRAGSGSAYYFIREVTPQQANVRPKEKGPELGTRPVGSYEPNALGLFDMHGNVHEWVWDEPLEYPRQRWSLLDPGVPCHSGSKAEYHGGWARSGPEEVRSAYRSEPQPLDFAYHGVGFRVLRELPPEVDLYFQPPLDPEWLKKTQALKGEEQVKEVVEELKRRNSKFGGQGIQPGMNPDGDVVSLLLTTDGLTDLMPLRALKGLTGLTIEPQQDGKSRLHDLSPLRGVRLAYLRLPNQYRLGDLRPLRRTPIQVLDIQFTAVGDLSPLRGMPLKDLTMHNNGVRDLSPLRGLPLEAIRFGGWSSPIHDLSPLKDCPLQSLNIGQCSVQDFSPLRGKPLKTFALEQMPKVDLSPLAGSGLEGFRCDNPEQYADFLRGLSKTLKAVNNRSAEEFFKDMDAGGPDRRAAAWVQKRGGKLTILVKDKSMLLEAGQMLPAEDFQVIAIDLGGVGGADDVSLANLAGLKRLRELNLAGAELTNAGIQSLPLYGELTRLSLHAPKLTDPIIGYLDGMGNLKELTLNEMALTDEGLARLARKPGLETVRLINTKVTPAGVKAFREAQPTCKLFVNDQAADEWVRKAGVKKE
jgi:eukaryotic-like serine/threonine-protein kinase